MAAKLLVALALLCALVNTNEAYYFFTSSIHDAYKGVFPGEVSMLYGSLNVAEMEQMKLAGTHFEDAEALRVLESLNGQLHARVVESRNNIQQKIDSLEPEARQFVNELIAKARDLRPAQGEKADLKKNRSTAAKIVAEFDALRASAKANLAKVFPEICSGLQGGFREFAEAGEEEL